MGIVKKKIDLDEVKSQIKDDFRLAIDWNVNLAYQAMVRIMSVESEYQSELFQYVLETWGKIDQEKVLPVPEVITKEEETTYEKLYADMADALLKAYLLMGVDMNWGKENFYEELWRGIWGNAIWDDDKKRAFVVYYIAIDIRIPYYSVNRGVIINKKEMSSIIKKIIVNEYLDRFYFIDAMDWSSDIERTSLILDLLSELTEKKEKSVFLAMILNEYKLKGKEMCFEEEKNGYE